MGIIQKDAFRTMLISYMGIILGYFNKGLLFLIILTTEQIGLVNLVIAVGMLFAQMANFGSIFTIWKFIPFFKNEKNRHHGFFPFILLVVIAGILSFTILALIFRTKIENLYLERAALFSEYYIWILPIGISYVLFMVLEAYLRSFYKNIVSVIALEIVLRIAVTISLFLIWFNWISFDTFVIVNSLAYLIPTLILVGYLFLLNEFNLSLSSVNISKKFRKIIFKFSSFYYVNTLGIVLVSSMDVMMVAQMVGLSSTGVFSTIVFLASALQVPYKSLIRIASPLVSDYWKQREFTKMTELYRKVSSVSLVIGFGMFILIWVNIDFFFTFLKPEFSSGIWVFFFLMMGRLVDMYFGLNGAIFTTSKKYKYDIYFTLFLIVAVFVLNLIMIPIWGITGAAISTSIAMIVYNIGRIIFVWKAYKIHPFHKNQLVVIALGICTILAGELTSELIDNKWLQFIFESVLAFIIFFLPIYLFSLEPELKNYVQKGSDFLLKKVKNSAKK